MNLFLLGSDVLYKQSKDVNMAGWSCEMHLMLDCEVRTPNKYRSNACPALSVSEKMAASAHYL